MRTLCTLIFAMLMLTASAQSYFRLTKGDVSGEQLEQVLTAEGFDAWIIERQMTLPKVTAQRPTRPTVPQHPDPNDEWGQYTIAMREYSLLYNEQLQAREDFLNGIAYDLEYYWLFIIQAYMKVCPNPRKPHRKVWCWSDHQWHYRQWANILMQIWRKLPTYPSAFVAYHMNDHRVQLKDRSK